MTRLREWSNSWFLKEACFQGTYKPCGRAGNRLTCYLCICVGVRHTPRVRVRVAKSTLGLRTRVEHTLRVKYILIFRIKYFALRRRYTLNNGVYNGESSDSSILKYWLKLSLLVILVVTVVMFLNSINTIQKRWEQQVLFFCGSYVKLLLLQPHTLSSPWTTVQSVTKSLDTLTCNITSLKNLNWTLCKGAWRYQVLT